METPAPRSMLLGPRGASVRESFLMDFTFVRTLIKAVKSIVARSQARRRDGVAVNVLVATPA